MILSDRQIKALCAPPPNADSAWKPLLENFVPEQVRRDEDGNKIISYGVSSYGYDLRVADEFKVFTNVNSAIVDPKQFDKGAYKDIKGPQCIIPPNSFVLARSIEKFNMPLNMLGIVLGKSTYARVGIICICTPAEPGWSGHLTLEFANTTPCPAVLYANEGGCQVVFFEGDECEINYARRNGKYQNQGAEIVLPTV